MSAAANGRSAFPTTRGEYSEYSGMSMRDYFAAKAMEALINATGTPFDRISQVPAYAYAIADAMIKERSA